MSEKRRTAAGILLLAAAAALILTGIMTGEMQTVFAKASKICMECIGIG
jgi:hypothetical protein